MSYKFDGKRLMTNGVNNKIPLNIQIAIWGLVDELVKSDNQVDYLQVFKLTTHTNVDNTRFLHIKHSQEVPPYNKDYVIDNIEVEINDKIYVIDDVEHCTMLFASEY